MGLLTGIDINFSIPVYSGITTLETVQARPLVSYKLFTLFYIKHITRGGCGHESSCTLACMVHRRMEGDGCPPPAKQVKLLFRYGCQVDGRAASSECGATLRVNAEASADNTTLGSTTSTEAHDRLSRLNLGGQSSSSMVLTDGTSGSHSSETCESSTESSVYELGKPTDNNFFS